MKSYRTAVFSVFIMGACLAANLPGARSEMGALDKDPSLLLWLPMDEGRGTLALDRSANNLEGLLNSVEWAGGEFGTAPFFGGTGASIGLPPVPGLDGSDAMTISLWAFWEEGEPRKHPNLLSSHNWGHGGILLFVSGDSCYFRIRTTDTHATERKASGKETGAPLLSALPRKRWTHLCVTFEKPHITTYVNGGKVGGVQWPHAVRAEGLTLGSWGGAISHHGMLDDLRIYKRALTAEEVKTLANARLRASADYVVEAKPFVASDIGARLATRHAELLIGKDGQALSLRSKSSQRELLASPRPLLSLKLRDGRTLSARSMVRNGKTMRFGFGREEGECVMEMRAYRHFIDMKVVALRAEGAESLTFCSLPVTTTQHRGHMANMLSDDIDGVCLRGYDLPVEMSIRGDVLTLSTTKALGLSGVRGGLAAGSKRRMAEMLRAMATRADVPRSVVGGPWTMDAEGARESYLFTYMSKAATDDWIDLAQRGGFTTLHHSRWYNTLGHYEVRTNLFPRGLADMRESVEKVHRAGLKFGIHTLTGCISIRDPWVKDPAAQRDFIPWASYTLARPMSPADTVLHVNEQPIEKHDVVFTYSSNGNAIRIGSEIVQYTAVSRTPPYTFAGCKRGAFGTAAAAHSEGDQADYLQQRYMAFYPQPDSALADQLAERIARTFNACRMDQIYFDGAEGMMSRYGNDAMRHKIFARLHGDALVESSCGGAHNWWYRSRLGTWDHAVWSPKRFQDKHVASTIRYRATDLLEPQMGWWAPRVESQMARGHFLDEMEYFACKNMGMDGAMSIQGVSVESGPLPDYIERQMTLLGWYERLRLARYFDDRTIERIAPPGEEFRLRQEPDGAWLFTPSSVFTHRVTGAADGSESWSILNSYASHAPALRVEALYGVEPYPEKDGVPVLGAEEFDGLRSEGAPGVRLSMKPETSDTRGASRNLCLEAVNNNEESRGKWARAMLSFSAPYRDLKGKRAFGLWVKGDGSGALLNVQLGSPREYRPGTSDHYVRLDFKGWRYIELLIRERDVERHHELGWPHGRGYGIYRTPVTEKYISHVALYLNELPPGKPVSVTVSPIIALATRKIKLENPAITLNGREFKVPVTLESGEFAEIEPDNTCTHYSGAGRQMGRIELADNSLPGVRAGENTIGFACATADGSKPRAELAITTLGEKFGAVRRRREIDWQRMTREYEMAQVLTDAAGEVRREWSIAVRGGGARLEIELWGGMESPVLHINGKPYPFPVALKSGERLQCRDRRSWRIIDKERKVVSEGVLAEKLPLLRAGAQKMGFTCANPASASVKLTKVY